MIINTQVYVQKVKDGSLSPSSPLGAAVLEAIDRLALVEAEDLAGQVRERSQDVALLSYLTTLIQAQVQIAERIHSVL